MALKVGGHGPAKADIVIVGEAPGFDEEMQGKPFVGASGKLLDTLLREAGIRRADCYVTNVCKYRPPGNDIGEWLTDNKRTGKKNEWTCINGRYAHPLIEEGLSELYDEVAVRSPKIVVGLGNTALWAFTGEWGITDWRGSEIVIATEDAQTLWGTAFVPTLHPAGVLRSWPTRAHLAHDLACRVARRLRARPAAIPAYSFNTAPTLAEVSAFLRDEVGPLGEAAVDVETSRGRIVCVGIALSSTRALCIPFIHEGYGAYWSASEQTTVVEMLRCSLPNIRIIGQNFNYDASYFYDNFGMPLAVAHDTKIAQNVLFPGTPANLAFLSSMYCDYHCYWKDDHRDWQNLKDFDRLFTYNCRDVCATYEVAQAQRKALAHANLEAQFAERMRYDAYVFRMQQRGLLRSPEATQRLEAEVQEKLEAHERIVGEAAGRAINLASPAQVAAMLYKDLGCRRPLRAGGGGTGDEALQQVAKWHPEHAPVCQAILEWRSLASMRNNFLRATLDPDEKLRSAFSTTGTETFRLTSKQNNFYRGTNLLNISSGKGKNAKKYVNGDMPNFRAAIAPPGGYTIFDCDLARADLQVVVWEADDADLKHKLRAGVDIHTENAKDLFGVCEPSKLQRELAKTFVHLTDYGGGARTCAIQCGTTVHEADMAQRRWFAAHPGIKEWHERTWAAIRSTRTVTNAFGYRIVFFDRVDDSMFRNALAWVPQSTIAIVASLVHMRMEDDAGVDVLLQMYDSVTGMYPTVDEDVILPKLLAATKVPVPYADPLTISMGLKTSTVSWGDVEDREWP